MVTSLAYRTDLALLEFGGTVIDDRGDHLLVRTPHNPRYWWGNYLLLPVVPPDGQVDRWIEGHGAAFPAAEHVALGFDVTTGTKADLAAFAARGMEVEALTVLTAHRTHPPRARHPAATNRALTTDDDWEQSVQLTLRCYPGDPVAEDEFVRAKATSNRKLADDGHGGWFGAFLDGRLAAQMGLFTASPGLARFQAVETDPDFRRQGLAGGLVHHVSQFGFAQLGASTLVMVADPDYVAIDLYRAVGFAETETQLQATRPPHKGAAADEHP